MYGPVTVIIADGTYDVATPISLYGEHSMNGRHKVDFVGNPTTPANVVLQAAANNSPIFDFEDYGCGTVSGVTLQAKSGFTGCIAIYSRQHAIGDISNSVIGAFPEGDQLLADEVGTINLGANLTISGGGDTHGHMRDGGIIELPSGNTVTITGTPTFDEFFAVDPGGILTSDGSTVTYDGDISGPAFNYARDAVVNIGATVLPGSAGTDSRSQSLATKIISVTRDMTAASGSVSYTGVGFTPTALIAIGVPGAVNTDFTNMSFGMSDAGQSAADLVFGLNTGDFRARTDLIFLGGSSNFQKATVSSYDSDGFTLSWVKSGTPSAATAQCYILCLR